MTAVKIGNQKHVCPEYIGRNLSLHVFTALWLILALWGMICLEMQCHRPQTSRMESCCPQCLLPVRRVHDIVTKKTRNAVCWFDFLVCMWIGNAGSTNLSWWRFRVCTEAWRDKIVDSCVRSSIVLLVTLYCQFVSVLSIGLWSHSADWLSSSTCHVTWCECYAIEGHPNDILFSYNILNLGP
jgi:hypothetical protein